MALMRPLVHNARALRLRALSQRGAVGLGALLSVMAVLSGLLVGSGNASKVFELGNGLGWVSDNSPGGSGVAGVSVGSADSDWRGVGNGSVRRVTTGTDGSVWAQVELDSGSFEWRMVGRDGAKTVAGSGAEDAQVVVTGGGTSWLVDLAESSVRSLTLKGAKPFRVEPSIRGGVRPVAGVDGRGRLVVATTSSVVVLGERSGRVRELARFDAPDKLSSVVVLGDEVLLVSAGSGTARVLDGDSLGRRLRLGANGERLLVPGRSSGRVLWVMDPVSGQVLGTHIDGRRVGELKLPSGVSDWVGPPVVVGDVVMIRARVDGRLALWRGAAGSSGFRRVDMSDFGTIGSCDGGCGEVFESGGRLWVNRSTEPSVAIVDSSGQVRVISKGRPNPNGDGGADGSSTGDRGGVRIEVDGRARADVPTVPFRRPPSGAPAGAGQIPGANPGRPTMGEGGEPTVKAPLDTTPDTVAPVEELPPSGPSHDDPQNAGEPCVLAPSIVGSHAVPPEAPVALKAQAGKTVNGVASLNVSWSPGPGDTAVCAYKVTVQRQQGGAPAERTVAAQDHGVVFDALPIGEYRVEVRALNNNPTPGELAAIEVRIDPDPDLQPTPGATVVDGACRFEWRSGSTSSATYVEVRLLSATCEQINVRFTWRGPTYAYRSDRCDLTLKGPVPTFERGFSGPESVTGKTTCSALSGGWYRNEVDNAIGAPLWGACLTAKPVGVTELQTHSIGDPPGPVMGDVWSPDPCTDKPRTGDLNWDGKVGCHDLNHILDVWRVEDQRFEWGLSADIDGDGLVSGGDLATLLVNLRDDDGGVCKETPQP